MGAHFKALDKGVLATGSDFVYNIFVFNKICHNVRGSLDQASKGPFGHVFKIKKGSFDSKKIDSP